MKLQCEILLTQRIEIGYYGASALLRNSALVSTCNSGREEAMKRRCGNTEEDALYFRFHPSSHNRIYFCNLTLGWNGIDLH
jgi:hypothetical protein